MDASLRPEIVDRILRALPFGCRIICYMVSHLFSDTAEVINNDIMCVPKFSRYIINIEDMMYKLHDGISQYRTVLSAYETFIVSSIEAMHLELTDLQSFYINYPWRFESRSNAVRLQRIIIQICRQNRESMHNFGFMQCKKWDHWRHTGDGMRTNIHNCVSLDACSYNNMYGCIRMMPNLHALYLPTCSSDRFVPYYNSSSSEDDDAGEEPAAAADEDEQHTSTVLSTVKKKLRGFYYSRESEPLALDTPGEFNELEQLLPVNFLTNLKRLEFFSRYEVQDVRAVLAYFNLTHFENVELLVMPSESKHVEDLNNPNNIDPDTMTRYFPHATILRRELTFDTCSVFNRYVDKLAEVDYNRKSSSPENAVFVERDGAAEVEAASAQCALEVAHILRASRKAASYSQTLNFNVRSLSKGGKYLHCLGERVWFCDLMAFAAGTPFSHVMFPFHFNTTWATARRLVEFWSRRPHAFRYPAERVVGVGGGGRLHLVVCSLRYGRLMELVHGLADVLRLGTGVDVRESRLLRRMRNRSQRDAVPQSVLLAWEMRVRDVKRRRYEDVTRSRDFTEAWVYDMESRRFQWLQMEFETFHYENDIFSLAKEEQADDDEDHGP